MTKANRTTLTIAQQLNGCFISLRALNSLNGAEAAHLATTGLRYLDQLTVAMTEDGAVERLESARPLLAAMQTILKAIKAGEGKLDTAQFGLMDAFHRTPLLIVSPDEPVSIAFSDTKKRLNHHQAWSDLIDLSGEEFGLA